MDIAGVREALLDLTQFYFQGATVMYGRQSHVAKQGKPLVTLYTRTVTRTLNPPVEIIDGRPVSFYPSSVSVQIDLFTFGKKKEVGNGYTPVMENTAADDMLSFVNFLNSEYAIQYCQQKDIAIVVPNTVQDLTGLINDISYEFRAMIEVTVYFTSTAIGYSGILSASSISYAESEDSDTATITPEVETSSSGGGNENVLTNEEAYFENVSINNTLMKEEN